MQNEGAKVSKLRLICSDKYSMSEENVKITGSYKYEIVLLEDLHYEKEDFDLD